LTGPEASEGNQTCAGGAMRIPSDLDVAAWFGDAPGPEDIGTVGVWRLWGSRPMGIEIGSAGSPRCT